MSQASGDRRILIYSHDTFGLGHLRRCRAIAHALVEEYKHLSVMILSGSPIIGSFDFRARVDFVRVPGVIKLRNGEFVNPELLERIFARVPLIEHVLVYGDQQRDYPLPLVTVDVEEAKNSGIAGLPLEDETALRVHPGLGERIREGLLAEAAAAGLPSYQRPQRVALLPEPLSEDAGMLTKGLKKVVPKAIVDQYRDLVEETYRS